MYLKLFRASEEAVNLLIAAQQEYEELYRNAPDPEWKVILMPGPENEKKEWLPQSGVLQAKHRRIEV